MSSIHGHEVLQMMITSKEDYTKSSLISAIEQKFGANARFHTCSQSEMTAAELVNFLEKKGKFIASDSGFTTHENKICKH
jgi:probable metal-binding protein